MGSIPMARFFRSGSQQGGSLISMLVAVGIMGILALAFANTFTNNMKTLKDIQKSGDVEDIKRLVRLTMDCTRTVAAKPASCPLNTYVNMKRIATSDINLIQLYTANPPPTVIANYGLRAKCGSSANSFLVDYCEMSVPGGSSCATWKPLFSVPIACP